MEPDGSSSQGSKSVLVASNHAKMEYGKALPAVFLTEDRKEGWLYCIKSATDFPNLSAAFEKHQSLLRVGVSKLMPYPDLQRLKEKVDNCGMSVLNDAYLRGMAGVAMDAELMMEAMNTEDYKSVNNFVNEVKKQYQTKIAQEGAKPIEDMMDQFILT